MGSAREQAAQAPAADAADAADVVADKVKSRLLDRADASDAITILGSDLTFSIAFATASELLAVARDAEFDELYVIVLVLMFSVIFSGAPASLELLGVLVGVDFKFAEATENSLVAFFISLLSLTNRISQSIAVQLLAQSVIFNEESRFAKILSFAAVAIFFVFLTSKK